MSMKNETTMPEGLEYWTADEVAECLSYGDYLPAGYEDSLYDKLWSILAAAKNATPLGGDGSDGTVETPDGRLDLDNDDKASHWWSKLTGVEANAIAEAYHRDNKYEDCDRCGERYWAESITYLRDEGQLRVCCPRVQQSPNDIT